MSPASENSYNACVFASQLLLTVSVEKGPEDRPGDELHFHPGGQGFWIARMLAHLGARPVLVAPIGGESGAVLRGLAPVWGVELLPVVTAGDSPAYVHDRRTGTRVEVAESPQPTLNRHERDDLYARVLEAATGAGLCVVTGRPRASQIPIDFYERLGADLHAVEVTAVGDLHAEELTAFLSGGPLHILKVSDEDLVQDGLLPSGASTRQRIQTMNDLIARGVGRVVLSSADGPTLIGTADAVYSAAAPHLEAADHRGSGDSMTAGLTYAALKQFDTTQTVRLACAAGAANAARHGLGNADADLIRALADRVEVERL